MKKLELTCTYAEWKKNRELGTVKRLSQDTARLMELQMKDFLPERLTEEEKKERDELEKSTDLDMANNKYTDLCHQITDKCLNPVGADIDYEEIGRLQCEVERLKYPCVLPEDEMNDKE